MWLLLVFLLQTPQTLATEPAKSVTLTGAAVNAEDGSGVPRGTLSLFGVAGGVYNLRIKEGKFSGEIPAGDGYRLQTWAPGFAEFRLNNVSVYPGMAPLKLTFLPTRPVTGQVVDEQGRGIPQARVGLAFDAEGTPIRMGVMANEEGLFRMDFASDPRVFYLVVSKGGYQSPAPIPFDYPTQDALVIELRAKPVAEIGSIVGVATMGGKPLQGLDLDLTRPDGLEYQRSEIDSEGGFHFPKLNPGEYSLRLLRRDRNHTELATRDVTVSAGGPTRVEFALAAGVEVSGVVSDTTGRPVRNAVLTLDAGMTESRPLADTPAEREALRRRSLREPVSHNAISDDEGRFDFVAVEPGSYRLSVHSRPYLDQEMSVEVPWDENPRVVLERGLSMRAVLLDRDGQVIKSFHYSIGRASGEGRGESGPVVSGQGLFVVSGLRPAIYSFSVYLPDGRAAEGFIDLGLGEDVVLRMPSNDGDELTIRYKK